MDECVKLPLYHVVHATNSGLFMKMDGTAPRHHRFSAGCQKLNVKIPGVICVSYPANNTMTYTGLLQVDSRHCCEQDNWHALNMACLLALAMHDAANLHGSTEISLLA